MRCTHCQEEFEPKVYWMRFCSDACRSQFHCEETRRGRELVRREREAGERAA
jgi:hypothetical protein